MLKALGSDQLQDFSAAMQTFEDNFEAEFNAWSTTQ